MKFKLPKIYPTKRLAFAFAAGSLWFFAAPTMGFMFQWFGLGYIVCLLVLAAIDISNLRDSRKCTVSRVPETVLSLGEQNPVFIEIEHDGSFPLWITVKDEPPQEFEVHPRTLTLRMRPQEYVKANYKVKPNERGHYIFGSLNVRYTTILGLMMREERISCEMPVKVYPDVFQTKKHLVLARENRATQMGLRKSRLLGQGYQFERLRDYVPDDSMRHVDWKATARRGSLITREYDVEQSQHIMIVLDMGRTMASRTVDEGNQLGMTKADYAINASVLLAHVAAQSDDRVGLFCFAESPITFVPPGKGKAQASALMEALYDLQPRTEESDYFVNLNILSQKQRKRSLVFVFTDLIDPESSRSLITSMSLLIQKHLVVCIALADYELPTILDTSPANVPDMYTQAVALSIIHERRRALAQLSKLGVITIDATPSDLTVSAVNKYLQLKREARI